MDRLGIVGALDEEIEQYVSEMSEQSRVGVSGFCFHSGKLLGKDVVVVKCGAGKVNAGICVQTMIDRFRVSSVIFTGVAGAVNPDLGINDIVISKDSMQHDMDATGLGFDRGHIPFTDLRFFRASPELVEIADSEAQRLGLKAVQGRILTGDQFINDLDATQKLWEVFGGDCVDMESAAVGQACALNGIPHVIIRSISDKADSSAPGDFKAFCKRAADNSFSLVKGMVSHISRLPGTDRSAELVAKIRTIPNWPKKGIMFRDITTLLKDSEGFRHMLDLFCERYKSMDIDIVAGVESRGFIIGSAVADRLGKGFVPIRKAGKLPAQTVSVVYSLEYGKDHIEMHEDAIVDGAKVLLVDDLIATGGTALAACELIEKLGGRIVECGFVINLKNLPGKAKLEEKHRVFSLLNMEG